MFDKLIFKLQDTTATPNAESIFSSATKPVRLEGIDWVGQLEGWGNDLINFGIRVLIALLIFIVGRFLIRKLIRVFHVILQRRGLEGVAVTLLDSIVKALLYLMLGIFIVSTLGVKSASFAAIIASMGLAIGMALSGQLQNLAGGVIILVTSPFKIGDFIEAQNVTGKVEAVTLFHTRIVTIENKIIYIPNGILSSGVVINYSQADKRRAEWIIGVEYNQDFDQARALLMRILSEETRILQDPEPMVELKALNSSSVDIVVRAWTLTDDLWPVYFAINKRVYEEFNQAGIGFPFPQLTVHQAKS